MAIDPSGNVHIADEGANVIEKVTPSGALSIFAGSGSSGPPVPGPATASPLGFPYGVAADRFGNVFIVDTSNNMIEAVDPSGTLSVVAGTGANAAAIPGPATDSPLGFPYGAAVDADGNLYIADSGNSRVEIVGAADVAPLAPPASTPVLTGGATAATPDGAGYWSLSPTGFLRAHGSAADLGSTNNVALKAPVVGINSTTSGNGYWLAASDGGVFTYGDARFFGSTGSLKLKRPVNDIARTTDDEGYWLSASDGGVFTFGDARFYGSTGALTLDQPVVGINATPDGKGYWLVASDGGVITFGDAKFHGSLGTKHLDAPIVAITPTPDGGGYWLTASDGGVFTFGDARFFGSLGGTRVAPINGMIADGNQGYRLVATSGGTTSFGTVG